VSQRNDTGFDPQDLASGQPTRSLLEIVWRRKALVSLGAVAGLVLGVLFYSQQQPIYEATAQVMVIKKRGDPMPIAGGDLRMSYIEDYVASHLIVIRSPLIAERAVQKRNLSALRTLAGAGDAGWAVHVSLAATRDSRGSDSGPNNIINLSFRGPVPEDCRDILSAVIDSYQSFLDEAYHNVSDENVNLIMHHRNVLKQETAELQSRYDSFLDQHRSLIFRGADGLNSYRRRALEIEEELTRLTGRKGKLQASLQAVADALKAGRSRAEVLALAAPPVDPVQKPTEHGAVLDKVFLLRMEEKRLRESEGYGPGHSAMQSVRAQIDEAERLLHESAEARGKESPRWLEEVHRAFGDPLDRYVKMQELEVQKINGEEAALRQQLKEVKDEAVKLDDLERKEGTLRSAVAKANQELEDTTKRLNEINRVRDAGGFDAQILSKPARGLKVAPSIVQALLGGLVLGLLAGIGLGYLAESADKSFRTPQEIRRRLGLPLVGHIPRLEPDAEAARKIASGHVVPDPLLCSHYRPQSVEAEAYRAVRTALYFSTQGESHKVIQVTSPDMGDGKSTLAANLAVSIAQSGKRVVLVDADCRRPRQHKVFAAPAPVGLACVLSRAIDVQDALRPSGVDGLDLLPCGPVPTNPAELLTSPRFQELLEDLRGRYDFVLIDTPPLLAVTDPCMVAARVDGVLLTIRLSKKGRPSAERAKEVLVALGANIVGVVVNGVDQNSGPYYADAYSYSQDYHQAEPSRSDAPPEPEA
jgi:capsular exopolysaccharide synthesis family protein